MYIARTKSDDGLRTCSWLTDIPQPEKASTISATDIDGNQYCPDILAKTITVKERRREPRRIREREVGEGETESRVEACLATVRRQRVAVQVTFRRVCHVKQNSPLSSVTVLKASTSVLSSFLSVSIHSLLARLYHAWFRHISFCGQQKILSMGKYARFCCHKVSHH